VDAGALTGTVQPAEDPPPEAAISADIAMMFLT
jgi:hypothetical protein